jgi:arsenate reductase
MKKVLFVCVENAGRSQMAEAFANYYGEGKLIVSSAGNKPADNVNPTVVEALKEKGIDISMNKPKMLTFQMAQDADLIVTMGCNDQGICPGPFFKPTVDWKLEDPKGKPIDKVREIRDEIERRVQNLVAQQTQGLQSIKKKGEQNLGIYVGLKEKSNPEIFDSEKEPTKETHPQYDIIYGPFKSIDDAQRYVKAMGGLACGDV